MSSLDWIFEPYRDGSWTGWNDGAIASFKANRQGFMMREMIQNSLDAYADSETPVTIEFKQHRIPKDQIPSIEKLEETFRLCKESYRNERPEDKEEIKRAVSLLEADEIPVLSVSDWGTRGMAGPPDEVGSPFFSYLKASGHSQDSAERTGSHGLGKFAPLSSTVLRTIVVSTRWLENGAEQSLIQGRANLMSHEDDKNRYKAVGYWGKGYDAITNEQCPSGYAWLHEEPEIGTTIHILGWTPYGEDWVASLIGHSISNFFAAFARDKLILRISEQAKERRVSTIDSANVGKMFTLKRVADSMKKQQLSNEFEAASHYYECLQEKSEEFQLSATHLGHCGFKILVKEGAPRSVALLRNNMLITDAIPNFWKIPPSSIRDFVGVFECDNPRGNKLIRSMEPPAHDQLLWDILPTEEKKDLGRKALKSLGDKLKELVKKHAEIEISEGENIDVLKEFLADEQGGSEFGQEEEINLDGGFQLYPKPPSRISATGVKPVEDEESEYDEDGVGVDGDGTGIEIKQKRRRRGTGGVAQKLVSLKNVRIVKTSARKATIWVTSHEDISVQAYVYEVGSDLDEELNVVDSAQHEVGGRGVKVNLQKSKRTKVEVTLDRNIVGGLKFEAFSKVDKG